MTMRRIRANSAASARRKAKGSRLVVTKVNKIKGSKDMYSVTTKKRDR